SGFKREAAERVMLDERVSRGPDGTPLASPEILVVANLPRVADGSLANVTLRGVTSRAFDVRGGIRVIKGRRGTPGLYELLVGDKAASRFGLEVGRTVRVQKREWDVVGVFASEGSGFESELWGDLDVMASQLHREGSYQSLVLRLRDPASLDAFATDVADTPGLQAEGKQGGQVYT